ncbi:hypothetical protein Tco_1123874 [Tanacetum coccineum]|uniref:Uncharacterized protein n=1 Tax=Tanacetum coccineum TaxID=301880 RepID=A0ABQ5J4W3_9ASTR
MHPSIVNSPAQASGSQGAVKKVTNNRTSLPSDLGPAADEVALSDDVTPGPNKITIRCPKVTRKEKQEIESDFNALRYENNDLRSKYTGASYEMVWVMREAIPQMVGKVLTSQEFEDEMEKVRSFLVDQGRELGRRECRDLSLTWQWYVTLCEPDPTVLEEIKIVELV